MLVGRLIVWWVLVILHFGVTQHSVYLLADFTSENPVREERQADLVLLADGENRVFKF